MGRKELLRRAEAILGPLKNHERQCHSASLKLVKAGVGDRVARGRCEGVGAQHSWAVIGDPYKPTLIIDPTLWSYRKDVKGIFIGLPKTYGHRPHGSGSIWDWGRPTPAYGPAIKLAPELSEEAQMFIDMLGPLDINGWQTLSNAPVGGWPAKEIFEAMLDTPLLENMVPIDKIGMLTDRNPNGLYF